jgi:hypothetical protein
MLKRLVLLALPPVLLLAACGGDNGDSDDDSGPTARATATDEVAAPTEEPLDDATPTTQVIATVPLDLSGGGSATSGGLFDTVNPLDFLGGFSGDFGGGGRADPALAAVLLTGGDLPAGFFALGDFGGTFPSEYGDLEMAMSMFASGDFMTDDPSSFGAAVMSAVVTVPPAALAEAGDPSEWDDYARAAMDDLDAMAAEYGFGATEFEILDASGLGDGGLGIHMVLDFSGLLDAFGAPPGSSPLDGGLAMDTFMFLHGEHLLMTMVMWPAAQSSGVDVYGLAATMDARAGGL